MPTSYRIDENILTRMQLRKLKALRKSVGQDIADKAFAQWYERESLADDQRAGDPNISIIEAVLQKRLDKIKFPRGIRYILRRGRGRIIVEPTKS